MTKSEFKDLQHRASTSGMTLKEFLKREGVAYSTYNYWWRKARADSEICPLAPISIRSESHSRPTPDIPPLSGTGVPGVTVAFPNGVRAHFGEGSEGVLMELLTRSIHGHVLPQ